MATNNYWSVVTFVDDSTGLDNIQMALLVKARLFTDASGAVVRVDMKDSHLVGPCLNQVNWDLINDRLAHGASHDKLTAEQANDQFAKIEELFDRIGICHVSEFTPQLLDLMVRKPVYVKNAVKYTV